MRGRYLVIGLVVVLAAVTGVLIYQGNQTQIGRFGAVDRRPVVAVGSTDAFARDESTTGARRRRPGRAAAAHERPDDQARAR